MIVHDSCPVCSQKDIFSVLTAKDYTVSGEHFEIWQCNNCTLRFTQNIPDIDSVGRYYQSENYISHSNSNEGTINNLYHKVRKRTLIKKRKLVEQFTGKKKGKILDVGSGTGAFLDTMAKDGWQVTGLEPETGARDKARELYNIESLPANEIYNLPEQSFDAITLWHVLEHVHDLHGYMTTLKNLLRTGGKLFIAVPNYKSYDAKHYGQYWAAYDVPRHLYHFSPKAMVKLWNIHRMQVNSLQPMWYDSFYVSMLSEQYKSGHPQIPAAAVQGMLSNMNALLSKRRCSSLIYIGEGM